jgi:hypothetical protein
MLSYTEKQFFCIALVCMLSSTFYFECTVIIWKRFLIRHTVKYSYLCSETGVRFFNHIPDHLLIFGKFTRSKVFFVVLLKKYIKSINIISEPPNLFRFLVYLQINGSDIQYCLFAEVIGTMIFFFINVILWRSKWVMIYEINYKCTVQYTR